MILLQSAISIYLSLIKELKMQPRFMKKSNGKAINIKVTANFQLSSGTKKIDFEYLKDYRSVK